MKKILIKEQEVWDPVSEEFKYTPELTIKLEHSLASIHKWEMVTHKPFLSKEDKTVDETMFYIKCMALEEYDDSVFNLLTRDQIEEISDYINDPMTATTIKNDNNKPSREIITAEIIYFWMSESQIPFECQYWHLNTLLTLLQVCSIKRQPKKKMGKLNTMRSNHAINAARRARLGTTG